MPKVIVLVVVPL